MRRRCSSAQAVKYYTCASDVYVRAQYIVGITRFFGFYSRGIHRQMIGGQEEMGREEDQSPGVTYGRRLGTEFWFRYSTLLREVTEKESMEYGQALTTIYTRYLLWSSLLDQHIY